MHVNALTGKTTVDTLSLIAKGALFRVLQPATGRNSKEANGKRGGEGQEDQEDQGR